MLDASVQRPKYRKHDLDKCKHYIKHVFACFVLKVQGFVKIPGYEPVELDLEKLFLLSVSKENFDSRGNNEKILPYKISKKIGKIMFCGFS